MKKAKGLIILVCILALLVGAYFLVDSGILEKENAENPDKNTENPPIVDLTITKWSEPAANITLTNKNGKFSFVRMVEWSCIELPNYPISTSKLTDMAAILGQMQGTRRLEKTEENIKSFGLANPSATVLFTKNSGGSEKLLIGDQNQATTDYYVMLESVNAIFMMQKDYIAYFMGDAIYYVDIPELPDMEAEGISKLIYKNEKGTFEADKLNANNAKHVNLATGVSSLYLSAVEAPYTEDFAKYGLDNPRYYFYADFRTTDSEGVQSATQTLEIKVGDIYPEDDRYFYVTVSTHPNTVYRIFSGSLENLTVAGDALVK